MEFSDHKPQIGSGANSQLPVPQGQHIDDQGAHLFRLGNADSVSFDDSITVEYQTRDRRRCIEELLISDIADHSIRMYKSRFADRAS